jgi:hypothetical protein
MNLHKSWLHYFYGAVGDVGAPASPIQGRKMRVEALLKRWRVLLLPVLALGAGAGGYLYYFQPPAETISARAQYAEASLDDTRPTARDASDARPTADHDAPSRARAPTSRQVVARASDEGPRDTVNGGTSARVPPIVNAHRTARETADKVVKKIAGKVRRARAKVVRTVAGVDVKRITQIGRDFLLSLR